MEPDANVTPLRIGGNQRLYAQAGEGAGDDYARGLQDRGLATPHPLPNLGEEKPPEPAPEPKKPRGKKRAKVKPPNQVVYTQPKKKRNQQEIVSTLLELFGITVGTIGVGLIYVPAGLIFLGICAVVLGLALSTGQAE